MKNVSLEALLEAGCHFGHQVTRQNPKAREYIFEARDGIHIIDLEKTKEGLEEAGDFVKEIAQKEGTALLIVATKRQAETLVKTTLQKLRDAGFTDVYLVDKRWIGGTLTNFPEISKNFKKLHELKKKLADEYEKVRFTKREIGEWEKDKQKLESFYGGIEGMIKLPDALFVIDTHIERVAVDEARKMGIPVAGITDTNADPTVVDHPIPANDDAVGSIQLITDYIMSAWIEGKKGPTKQASEETKEGAEKTAKTEVKKKAAPKKATTKKVEKEA